MSIWVGHTTNLGHGNRITIGKRLGGKKKSDNGEGAILLIVLAIILLPITAVFLLAKLIKHLAEKRSVPKVVADVKPESAAPARLPDEFMADLRERFRAVKRRKFVTYQIAGVTEKTADGRSRQTQLRKLKMQEPPYDGAQAGLEIKDEELDGETRDAVYIEGFHFGWIAKRDHDQYVELAEYFDAVTAADVVRREDKYALDITIRYLVPAEPSDLELHAAEAVILTQKCDRAFLTQKCGVTYTGAGKVIDALADFGVIGDLLPTGGYQVLIRAPQPGSVPELGTE